MEEIIHLKKPICGYFMNTKTANKLHEANEFGTMSYKGKPIYINDRLSDNDVIIKRLK